METARAIGSGRVGGGATAMRHNIQSQLQSQAQPTAQQAKMPQQKFISSPPSVMMDANLNLNTTPALFSYPIIDQFKPQQQIHVQPRQEEQSQSVIQAVAPEQVPTNNAGNGVPFKLPSVQDRLIKNRVFFDDNLKNVAQTGNGKTVAGNQ